MSLEAPRALPVAKPTGDVSRHMVMSPRRLAIGASVLVLPAVAAVAVTSGQPLPSTKPSSSVQMVGRGVASTAAPEFATTLTPDGRELYFNRASDDRGRLTIMTATRAGESWSTPTVASFSGTYRDVDPFVTPDGRRLYFSSDRPRSGRREPRFATWYVDRRGEGWGDPVDPGAPLNSEAGDVFVSVARDGLMLFTSSRLGASRIFSSRQLADRWEVPQPIALGTETDGGNPAIAPSGRFAVLVRTPAGGTADLFVSCRTSRGWGSARPIAAVNSPFAEFAPYIDAAEQTLYFTSERPGVVAETATGARPPGDLYRVSLLAAGISCP